MTHCVDPTFSKDCEIHLSKKGSITVDYSDAAFLEPSVGPHRLPLINLFCEINKLPDSVGGFIPMALSSAVLPSMSFGFLRVTSGIELSVYNIRHIYIDIGRPIPLLLLAHESHK